MFGRKEKSPSFAVSADKIETTIGPTADFNGHLKSDAGIRIDGAFEGLIETTGNAIIGEGAKVLADISARNVSVAGTVKGNITASGRLEILSSGRVWGDIHVASFLIEEGGVFRGQSLMQAGDEQLLIDAPRMSGAPELEGGPRPEKTKANARES